MQTTYFWSKLDLHGKKIIALCFLLLAVYALQAQSYRWARKNNPNYDNRKLSYGFLIGLHTTAFKVKYSEKFVTPQFDSLYAVQSVWSPGFSLGFIVNYKLGDFFDLRLTPKVAFYEYTLRYEYTNGIKEADPRTVESTFVELPLLLKYKSERRGNVRMYVIGGVKPGIEASNKQQQANETLVVKRANFSADFGFGFDFYYPLFKFSPEIRFSKGLVDMLDNRRNSFGQPIDRLNTNMITVYLLFQ